MRMATFKSAHENIVRNYHIFSISLFVKSIEDDFLIIVSILQEVEHLNSLKKLVQ